MRFLSNSDYIASIGAIAFNVLGVEFETVNYYIFIPVIVLILFGKF
jgi:hypothetical protein